MGFVDVTLERDGNSHEKFPQFTWEFGDVLYIITTYNRKVLLRSYSRTWTRMETESSQKRWAQTC